MRNLGIQLLFTIIVLLLLVSYTYLMIVVDKKNKGGRLNYAYTDVLCTAYKEEIDSIKNINFQLSIQNSRQIKWIEAQNDIINYKDSIINSLITKKSK